MAALMAASMTVRAQVFTADTISDEVFARMKGKSFAVGCNIPRSELRYLSVAHYDLSGNVRQGEMVCHRAIADDLLEIFRELYRNKYPIERMRLIDDYDGDDERSMTANNTSCFCYRPVSGAQRLSRHALGMAIDINPLYNPYVRGQRVHPQQGRPYADRSCRFDYKIERGDLLWRLFTEHGFRWGGSWRTLKDWQHFEK